MADNPPGFQTVPCWTTVDQEFIETPAVESVDNSPLSF